MTGSRDGLPGACRDLCWHGGRTAANHVTGEGRSLGARGKGGAARTGAGEGWHVLTGPAAGLGHGFVPRLELDRGLQILVPRPETIVRVARGAVPVKGAPVFGRAG